MSHPVYKEKSYSIVGACMEVHRQMGSGFLEAVYQECLALEFTKRQIPFQPQRRLELSYKGRPLLAKYVPDFVCFDVIILEIKGIRELTDYHRAQVLNYLKATQRKLGLLINFGAQKLQCERIVP